MNENNSTDAIHVKRTIALRNRRGTELVVVLEPWANEYVVEPDQTLEVVEENGEPGNTLEIDVEASHLVFYARPGSILRAYRDGEELL